MEVLEKGFDLHGKVDLTNDEYHASPGVSKSHLDVIAEQSPLHYWHRYINPNREPEEPSDALKLGTAIHSAILEPDLFTSAYVESPAYNMRTKEGKQLFADFVADNPGKSILSPDDMVTCLAIRDRIHTNPAIVGLLSGGRSEQSFYANDPETGELVKCRFDYLHDDMGMAIDVKSTRDASKTSFGKDVANLRYDIAPAWYFDVIKALYGESPKHWVWLCFEKTPPYAAGIYFAKPEDIERARVAARADFMKIVTCRYDDYWPDYAVSVEPLDMPAWVKR
jgi:hypothetical protein